MKEITKVFDKSVLCCSDDVNLNKMFVEKQLELACEILKLRGYMFLNEIYDYLDMPRTKSGQIYGWVCDERVGERRLYTIEHDGKIPDIKITFHNLRNDLINRLQED